MTKFYKFMVYLGLIAFLLIGGIWLYFNSFKPMYSGELKLNGLQEKTEIYYDDFGIPHIYAENEHDAYLALGFAHAQDRLFQMEMMRRVGGGRLAEILGESLVETDKFFRTLGINQIADKTIAEYYDPEDHIAQSAQAYLDGINQFIQAGDLPIEYTILGIDAEQFVPKDMFLIAGYMAFTFAATFRIEPVTDQIFQQHGAEYIKELGLLYGNNTQKIMNNKHADTIFTQNLASHVSKIMDNLPVPILYGSNGWVISAKKSASGKVILANDTHIGYAQPSVWYEAHMNYPGYSLYGNHLAGIPFALLGHNDFAAWGVTMFENDDMDLYREKVNPENENQVWAIDKWEDLSIRKEIIKIKGGKETEFEVKSSRHGPIMNSVVEKLNGNEAPVSVWWIYTKMDSQLLEAFYKLNHAKQFSEAEEAASLIAAPGLNIMYGDEAGNIAWWAAAKLVKRPEHVNPLMILDGASGNDDMLGYYDFETNPKSINPASGYVYSANNQPDSVAGIYYPGYYAQEFRAREIVQFMEQDKKWTIEDLKLMQTNVRSSTHPDLLAILLPFIEKEKLSDENTEIFKTLKQWDGEHNVKDIAPTIYYKFLYKVLEHTFADEIGESNFEGFVYSHTMGRSYPAIFKNDSSVWWDNVKTEEIETRSSIINLAFTESITELEKQLGSDISTWEWQKVHTIEHVHPIGRKKPFDKLFNVGPKGVFGGHQTINNIDFHLNKEGIYKATYGPAIRILFDFADPDNSVSILPTGESGRFMSPHYDDQFEMYNTGKYRKQMTNKKEIQKSERILNLLPSK